MNARLAKQADVVSETVFDWLAAEVASSSDPNGVNAVLDDYDAAIRGLKGGPDHPENFTFKKFLSHADRLAQDLGLYGEIAPEDKDYDQITAKVIFDGLIEVSGGFRDQCYLEARNAKEYMRRRKRVVGTNVGAIVSSRMLTLIPANGVVSRAKITPELLKTEWQTISSTHQASLRALSNRVKYGYHLGQTGSTSSLEMIGAQYNWLKFSVDAIILAAKMRKGDWSQVPFMEPRSISEQSGKLWFPLKETVDWAKVIAENPPA